MRGPTRVIGFVKALGESLAFYVFLGFGACPQDFKYDWGIEGRACIPVGHFRSSNLNLRH